MYTKRILIASLSLLTFCWWTQEVNAQLPPASFYNISRDVKLFSSAYSAIAEDQYGFIWFGSRSAGGMYRFDGYNLVHFQPDPNHLETSIAGTAIYTIDCIAANSIYAGTYLGFSSIDLTSGQIKTYKNNFIVDDPSQGNIQAFLYDSLRTTLWIGTKQGLARMEPGNESSFVLLLPDSTSKSIVPPQDVNHIHPDHQHPDLLWISASNGLYQYHIDEGKFTLLHCPRLGDSIISVTDLFQDEMGTVWVSTLAGHVLGYHPSTNKWTIYNIPRHKSDPSATEPVYSLLSTDEHEVWISSKNYVGRMDLTNGVFEGWEYDASRPDGLFYKKEYRDLIADRHGRLWVTSWYGIQYARQAFLPKSNNVSDIGVAITDITVVPAYENPNKPLLYKEAIVLKRDQRDITFHYVLPNPLDPLTVTYQYRLRGYDQDWITTDQRSVRYTRLSGGNYVFEIKAKEGDDQSWVTSTTLDIAIQKRMTELWWFWFLVVVMVIGIAFLLYRFLISRAKREERLKADFEHQVSEIQMEALRAQMNPHFLFNSLNSIKYYAISKSKEETAAYLSKFSLLVRSILNNSKERTIPLKDELDALSLYIEIEHLRLEGKFDYQIDIDSTLRIRQAHVPPMILQPYVENAIWHGLMHKETRGRLIIQVKQLNDQIQCIIEDNGIGRTQAAAYRKTQTDHKKSMGMQITQDRIALINRIYQIDTQVHVIDLTDEHNQPAGTRVVINIPLIRDEEE